MADANGRLAGADARFDCLRDGLLMQRDLGVAGAEIFNLFPGPREHPPSEEMRQYSLRDLKVAAQGLANSVEDAHMKECFLARPTFDLPGLGEKAREFEQRATRLTAPPTFEQYVDLQDRWERIARLFRELRGEPLFP